MSIVRPKTIQIFLPDGDPQGIRVAEITTRILRVIEVPRALVSRFAAMDDAERVGLYILLGTGDDDGDSRLYIGQTGQVGKRLLEHNRNRDFWNKALVAVSLTNSLTDTHARFLEWHSIRTAREVGRYQVENGNAGTRPHTPAPLEADCQEIHESVALLVATLGHPVFEPLSRAAAMASPEAGALYVCQASQADARGRYTEEGFVVLAGSSGRAMMVPSFRDQPFAKKRDQLEAQGVLRREGDRLVFTRDYLFSSPSAAATSVLGRTGNGWVEWRLPDGRTLDEVVRQAAEPAGEELAT